MLQRFIIFSEFVEFPFHLGKTRLRISVRQQTEDVFVRFIYFPRVQIVCQSKPEVFVPTDCVSDQREKQTIINHN